MTINAANHSHVLKRYCDIGSDNDQLIQLLRSELSQHEKALASYNELLHSTNWNLEERKDIFQDIQRSRRRRTACQIEIRRLNETPIILDGFDEHVQTRTREFERICEFRQIISAFVDSNNAVNFVMRALYVYEGVTYDLGDWVIRFGAPSQNSGVDVVSFRRAVRRAWLILAEKADRMPYPDYMMEYGDFCLGTNAQRVRDHFERENFLAGIQLIVGVVSSVNPSDIVNIPKAFFPYLPIEIGGVSWPIFSNGPMRST